MLQEGIIDVTGRIKELGSTAQGMMRMDSKSLKNRRMALNRRTFDAAGDGYHLARQLEYVYSEVMREEFPPQNAFEAFPVDTSVPAGAKTHTVRRISQQGEAKVHRGNSADIPRVGVTQAEEEFPVRHYVIGIGIDIFEEAASDYANSALRQELQTAAQVTMMEFANHKVWFGDQENGIYGVLNYPWVPKRAVNQRFSASENAENMLAALNAAANWAHEESKTVYSPNAVITSPRLARILRTKRINQYDNTKLADDFLASNPRITTIEEAWELQEAGPGGTDIMLFYRRDRRSVANVIPQVFTMLPAQQQGLETLIPCYMSHGGVVMRDVLNNLVCYIDAE